MAPYCGLKGKALHAAIWTEACFAVAIFGYNQCAAGGVLATPSFSRQFPAIDVIDAAESEKHYRSTIQGTVIALYTALGIFGALACTFLGDILGRRHTVFIAAVLNLIGSLLMATFYSLAQFIVSRTIIGLGTGGIIATVSVWQSELSKAESRGSHVSAFGIFAGIGLVLGLWLDFGFSYAAGSISWRFPFAFSGILSLFVMGGIYLLPESPRWLMKVNRPTEAQAILQLLNPTDQEIVEKEIRDIELALQLTSGNNKSSILSMFSMGPQRTFHRLILACTAQMMLQLTGVNCITYYASTVYEEYLGFPLAEAQILAAASQFCIVLGSILCAYTVDRYGRRTLMIFSAAANAVCFAFETGLVSNPENHGALKGAVFFLFLFYFVYCIGFLGIPFLYASEIAPIQHRASICGVSTAVSWAFNFLVAEVTPVAFTDIGYRYFIVYAVLNAAWVPLLFVFFPETAGRSLEEIDAIFAESKSIFDPPRVARPSSLTPSNSIPK
ncbi:Sugar transporter STL1 [Pseudocercospora fuligena]|uniref:Sugar transporter STL1 n=1 Tax=Pseudocercospora fuligena TaxID=685502 RepID=A0A8H6RKU5_9PEZI|nr:Sugar transporter STL1 [Pseudocercospora fuligena]